MKQFLRPLRALLPALLLVSLGTQAQNLNYGVAGATNVAGTYTDLGTAGTAIATANNDDANSAPQNIGFTFNYNGASFTQFVLNTNGFIRLGAVAPSGTVLYPSQLAASPAIDPVSSTNPANTNLILPFNQDLGPGNGAGGPEYRVATTGTAPSRVTTIQWKNVSDKPEGMVASQYANFSFQVKLYEGSNNIEFVYNTATPGTGTAQARFPNVGIKGSGSANGQTVLAAKDASSAAWSTATFITGNYTNFTLNYRANVGPDAGRTFRFTPRVLPANDIAVDVVYTLGRVSSFGSPVEAQAVVTNNSATAKTNIAVTLTVSGATTYTNTQTVATLASGASTLVTFPGYAITGTSGTNTLTVTVPADDVNTNNSATATQTITAAEHSYIQGTTYTGGVGVAAAGSIIVARHTATGPTTLSTVTPVFVGPAAGPTTYQVLVYSVATNGQPGTVLYTSPTRPRPTITGMATALADPVTVPNIPVNGDFYVGIRVIEAVNIGLGYQTESPLRGNTFFFTTNNGMSWIDLNTQSLVPRMAINVSFGPAPSCPAVTSLAAGSITNTGASISFTAPAGATGYVVTVTPQGGTATTITPAPTASPVTLTGLSAGTTYTVSVTNNCGPGNTSAPVTTTFTTTGTIPAPANDNPSGAINLTVSATCSPANGTNVGATTTTAAGYANPGCGVAASPKDVWYTFTTPATGAGSTFVNIAVTGAPAGQVRVFSAASNAGPFTPIACSAGANLNTVAGPLRVPNLTPNTTYYVSVSGVGSNDAQGTFTICVTGLATPAPATYATPPFTEGFEGTWIDVLGIRDVPSNSWRNIPANGNNSWRRDDDGASANWRFLGDDTDPTLNVYTVRASTGSHSARFHSYGTPAGDAGALDLHVNLSPAGTKTLSFDFINRSGRDSIVVLVSTNGGTTFGQPILTTRTSTTFVTRTVTIPSNSATTVIRFLATSDFGNDDMGIDNVQVRIVTATRNEALASKVDVYPNPAHRAFTLAVPAGKLHNAAATIYNSLGQAVQQRQLSLPAAGGTATFDVSNLAAGVYTLKLKTADELVVKQVVVE